MPWTARAPRAADAAVPPRRRRQRRRAAAPGTRTTAAVAALLAVASLVPCAAGKSMEDQLQDEAYKRALDSAVMTEVTLEKRDDFLTANSGLHVLLMYHDKTCGVCKAALPEFEKAALDFAGRDAPVVAAHMEGSKGEIKKKLEAQPGFRGFPTIHFFPPWNATSTEEKVLLKKLEGRTMRVVTDRAMVLDASRQAGMAREKDARRLRSLGATGKVTNVDLDDFTARFEDPAEGGVWLPLEALRAAEGAPSPEDEHETAAPRPFDQRRPKPTEYDAEWQKEGILDFAERMLRPAVMPLSSIRQFKSDMESERYAALVFCADELTTAFERVAATFRKKHRVYLATDPAKCPAGKDVPRPMLVVYSPAEQQWSHDGNSRAAIAVANASVMKGGAEELIAWAKPRFAPGFFRASYETFFKLLDAGRNVITVFVAEDDPVKNKVVNMKLRLLAKPVKVSEKGLDRYEYGDGSYSYCVVDGNLEGVSVFGIFKQDLPRVAVFFGPHAWVEDKALTIENLAEELHKVPHMVRFRQGIQGYFIRVGMNLYRQYLDWDRWASNLPGILGQVGRVVVFVVVLFLSCQFLWFMVKTLVGLIKSLLTLFATGDISDAFKRD